MAARAAAGWKISMTTMRPPQQGDVDPMMVRFLCFFDLSRRWRNESLTRAPAIDLTAGAGEEAVAADTVEALRKNMKQEAAGELVRAARQSGLTICPVARLDLRRPILAERGDWHGMDRDPALRRGLQCNPVRSARARRSRLRP
jgi:hypothetical protein